MIMTGLTRFRDVGLLLLRVGIAGSFILLHGGPKLMGGPELWAGVGGAMGNIGIHFQPTAWGLMAAIAESLGALLIGLGLFFRPACLMLAFTMFTAVVMHLSMPADSPMAGWKGASHALEMGIIFISLLLIGPGKYSFDRK